MFDLIIASMLLRLLLYLQTASEIVVVFTDCKRNIIFGSTQVCFMLI